MTTLSWFRPVEEFLYPNFSSRRSFFIANCLSLMVVKKKYARVKELGWDSREEGASSGRLGDC